MRARPYLLGSMLGMALIGVLLVSACTRHVAPPIAPPAADLTALAAGNTAFAVDLYHTQRGRPGNLFFSPHSLSLALAMTYAGARGNTAAQMATALHFELPPEQLHPAFHTLSAALASRAEVSGGAKGFQLHIANALWGQQGTTFLRPFLVLVAANYDGGFRLVDFAGAPDTARQTINDWVGSQTKDRIKELLPQGVVSGDTRLVLTNAVYFLAAWATQFMPANTKESPFTPPGGKPVTVPMMHMSAKLGYTEGGGWQAVALPYVGGQLAMLAVVPKGKAWPAFERALGPELLQTVVSGLADRMVQLSMPRFSVTSEFSLKEALMDLGMTDAFGPAADFTGMSSQRNLMITAVLHKAFVKVNEEGTEAAAATAVVASKMALERPEVVVALDRPFLYAIVDRPTGTVLFMGRVLNPKG